MSDQKNVSFFLRGNAEKRGKLFPMHRQSDLKMKRESRLILFCDY